MRQQWNYVFLAPTHENDIAKTFPKIKISSYYPDYLCVLYHRYYSDKLPNDIAKIFLKIQNFSY